MVSPGIAAGQESNRRIDPVNSQSHIAICEMQKVSAAVPMASVIICNFNYAAFLGAAIESALALNWPSLEVIVVDDGSTDASREVMESYGNRIRTLCKENGGQRTAYAAGLALSRGEMIIFLDSDDLLDQEILNEAAAVWSPAVSKVQVQMRVIDRDGRPTGAVFPPFFHVPTPAEIRRWMFASSAYPTPPGSGNVFSRKFLNDIFPIQDVFDYAGDSYTLAAAPALGNVETIAKPLACYRVHGRNDGAMASLDASKFSAEVKRAYGRYAYASEIARKAGLAPRPDAVRFSLSTIPYRLASFVLSPAKHPIPGDGRLKIISDAIHAAFIPQGATTSSRLALGTWTVVVALLPRSLAEVMIRWRFVATSRPAMLLSLMRRLRLTR
jgi:glycosyltransferase involved in cell wall biosynthesis